MTSEQRALLAAFAGRLGLDLSDDLYARLARHLDLLETWNRSVRLTGDRDRAVLVEKHCADSLAAAALMGDARRVVDIGSGAGFPGLVMAMARPASRFALVESRRKVCSFLSEVAGETQTSNAFVVWGRAERVCSAPNLRQSFDLAVSRAVAPRQFLGTCAAFLRPGASMLLMVTAATDRAALERLAKGHDATLARVADYRLPTGENRRIAVFSRG
jgi:16S rRNA (guanine527-N7)-methyltransferase